jgi:hypothetical protein
MIDGYTYLLMKFKKLVLWMILCKHDLQTREFSCDLEIVSVHVVEIPWNTLFESQKIPRNPKKIPKNPEISQKIPKYPKKSQKIRKFENPLFPPCEKCCCKVYLEKSRKLFRPFLT